MIELREVSKRYGHRTAVRDVSVTIEPGVVTGFLGPNGAGKSTTIRMIAGLDAPSAGTVLVNGRDFRRSRAAASELGVLLDGRGAPAGLRAHTHLLALARTAGVPDRRVDELLEQVGLRGVARQRVGTFSLGMTARLGVAAALLGDPSTVVLDEPMNGLDPEGVIWMRSLLTSLAEQGRTVFVSSHLLSEMQQTATRLVVLNRGVLVADTTVAGFVERAGGRRVRVRTPRPAALRARVLAVGAEVVDTATGSGAGGTDVVEVRGLPIERVGLLAFEIGAPVTELTSVAPSLEEAFLASTRTAAEHEEVPA